jgi:fatty acid desaturase
MPRSTTTGRSQLEEDTMGTNESGLDRIIRLVIAVVAVIVAFAAGAGSVLGIILFVVAAIMLVTAAVGFCPLYRIFGLSTNRAAARR